MRKAQIKEFGIMDIYQEIAELEAELRYARLTKAEHRGTVRRLHDLQRQLEIAEEEAADAGDVATADRHYDQWLRIESAVAL